MHLKLNALNNLLGLVFWLADPGRGRSIGHCAIPGKSPGWSWETVENLRPGQEEAAPQVRKQGKTRKRVYLRA